MFQARFHTTAGARAYIPEHAQSHCALIDSFAAAGLTVRRCLRAAMTGAHAQEKAGVGYTDVDEAALADVPAVLVWEVERA